MLDLIWVNFWNLASIAVRAEADKEYTHLLAYKEVRMFF